MNTQKMTTQEINLQIVTHQLQTAELTIQHLRWIIIKCAVLNHGFERVTSEPELVAQEIASADIWGASPLTQPEALELMRTLVGGLR